MQIPHAHRQSWQKLQLLCMLASPYPSLGSLHLILTGLAFLGWPLSALSTSFTLQGQNLEIIAPDCFLFCLS